MKKPKEEVYKNPVKKIIPSKLETTVQQLLYQTIGPYIPKNVTPNQITLLGALGGLAAIVCTLLTKQSEYFFLGAIAGTLLHFVADDLDGYVARSRGMSSKAGAYFDLITDVLFSTFLILAFGLTPYANLYIAAFAAPLYGIVNVTAMNYIIYFNEFLFPRVGPIQVHFSYIVMAIGGILGRTKTITIVNISLTFVDIVLLLGMLFTYYEMIRLQIQLFKRLKAEESK